MGHTCMCSWGGASRPEHVAWSHGALGGWSTQAVYVTPCPDAPKTEAGFLPDLSTWSGLSTWQSPLGHVPALSRSQPHAHVLSVNRAGVSSSRSHCAPGQQQSPQSHGLGTSSAETVGTWNTTSGKSNETSSCRITAR